MNEYPLLSFEKINEEFFPSVRLIQVESPPFFFVFGFFFSPFPFSLMYDSYCCPTLERMIFFPRLNGKQRSSPFRVDVGETPCLLMQPFEFCHGLGAGGATVDPVSQFIIVEFVWIFMMSWFVAISAFSEDKNRAGWWCN